MSELRIAALVAAITNGNHTGNVTFDQAVAAMSAPPTHVTISFTPANWDVEPVVQIRVPIVRYEGNKYFNNLDVDAMGRWKITDRSLAHLCRFAIGDIPTFEDGEPEPVEVEAIDEDGNVLSSARFNGDLWSVVNYAVRLKSGFQFCQSLHELPTPLPPRWWEIDPATLPVVARSYDCTWHDDPDTTKFVTLGVGKRYVLRNHNQDGPRGDTFLVTDDDMAQMRAGIAADEVIERNVARWQADKARERKLAARQNRVARVTRAMNPIIAALKAANLA